MGMIDAGMAEKKGCKIEKRNVHTRSKAEVSHPICSSHICECALCIRRTKGLVLERNESLNTDIVLPLPLNIASQRRETTSPQQISFVPPSIDTVDLPTNPEYKTVQHFLLLQREELI